MAVIYEVIKTSTDEIEDRIQRLEEIDSHYYPYMDADKLGQLGMKLLIMSRNIQSFKPLQEE